VRRGQVALELGRAIVLLGLIGSSGGDAHASELADQPAPLVIRDLNPFIQLYGLPPFDAAELTPWRRNQLQVTLAFKRYVFAAAEGLPNVALYDFQARAPNRCARDHSDTPRPAAGTEPLDIAQGSR
jgi:hypothetical protein